MSAGDRRVVITGLGAVTPNGSDVPALWDAVRAGRSGITRLPDELTDGLRVRVGGRVADFAEPALPANLRRRLTPMQRWAVVSADEALADARWSPPGDPHRVGIIAATGSGPVDAVIGAAAFADANPRRVPPELVVYGTADAVTGVLAQRHGLRGAAHAVTAACASGAIGIGEGVRRIRHGYADAVLVVGMDDCLGRTHLAANANLRTLATGFAEDPASASRPFDRARGGFVMGQGAAAVLLEADDHARERGARPYAFVSGFGDSGDAHHATAPDPLGHGAAAAIAACLADAGVTAHEVDHVNTHGTGTARGDAAEIAALSLALGRHGRDVPLTATKSTTGHLLGASGVVEAILAVLTLRDQIVPPTVNLSDPEFDDWWFARDAELAHPMRSVLSNSFGFGGHNAALLFSAV